MVELKELEKLSPKEKIRRLQELQKKNQEEIEKAQKLILESEEELEEEEKIEEMVRKVPMPEQKKVDVSELWKKETLEEQVKKEEAKLTEEQRQYGRILAETKPIEEISQNVYNMEKGITEKGYINQEEQERFQANVYALKRKEEGYKKAGLDYEAKKASRAQEEAELFLNSYRMAA